MGKVKCSYILATLTILGFFSNISVSNLTNINLAQTRENEEIVTLNESLIYSKGRTRNRLPKINYTSANSNDGEILKQKVGSANRKTRSGEMESRIAELLSNIKTTATNKSSAIVELDETFLESTTALPILSSQLPFTELLSNIKTTATNKSSAIAELDEIFLESTTALPILSSQLPFSKALDVEVESKTISIYNTGTIKPNFQKRVRVPVKLNMKQGLIMNQILGIYGLNDVKSPLCKNHIKEFRMSLRALEPWAVKMFDASSKLMSGVTGGNLADLGSFKQCLDVYEETIYGPIKGQHCTLHIHPTDELVKIVLSYRKKVSQKHFLNLKNNILDEVKLTWSVCVPHSCSHEDVLRHFNKSIVDVTEGLNLTLSLTKEHCTTVDDLPQMTKGDYIYIFCVAVVLLVVLISTIIDTLNEDCANKIVILFSLKRNAEILFSTSKSSDEIGCIHGMRALTMYGIVYGHRYIKNMATPVVNYMDLVDWLESYFSTTVHGGTMTVDTFLIISATLFSYTFSSMLSKGIRVNMFLLYLNRHMRILVPLALAVSTYATVVKHFGGGPLYRDLCRYYETTCGYFWWTALLSIQTFVNPRHICAAATWYLSIDMFWYYFSPPLLLTVARNEFAGYLVLISVFMGNTLCNFTIAWIYQFNGQLPVSPVLTQSDFYALHYIQPTVRGGPYILGLIFGHVLFKTKDQKIRISPFTQAAGWIVASICSIWVTIISRSFRLEGFEYNRLYACLFLSCHRTVWTLCIIWIIWSCQHGYGGIVNVILSWDAFKILGRLCYNIFLFHFLFQEAMQNSKKTPTYFSNFLSIFDSIADFVLMSFLAIPLTLCFEYPFTRMGGLLFKPKTIGNTIKVKPVETP